MGMTSAEYSEVPATDVPANVRWDVPARNQSQIVEIAYADPRNPRTLAEHGDPWKRVTDQSEPVGSPDRVRYYRLVGK